LADLQKSFRCFAQPCRLLAFAVFVGTVPLGT